MSDSKPSLDLRLDSRSSVPVYMQIVQQVRQALRLGFLVVGDQLPTVREVVANIAINPNTVFKAYRELESEGLVESHPGKGTFIVRTLADDSLAQQGRMRARLVEWMQSASEAGMDEESIEALFYSVLRASFSEERS